MARPVTVIGWKLPNDQREQLLQRFAPRYANVVADHVTLNVGASRDTPLPRRVTAEVVGRADDGEGVECLVVRIDAATDRPDGSTYHITWSLGDTRKARESNDVLRANGWEHIDKPTPIELEPARF